MTYNSAAKQIDGGNFGTHGPALSRVVSNGNPYKRSNATEISHSRRFAYRHTGETLNAVYYDGHAANLSVTESQRVVSHFPSGAVVKNRSNLLDDSVSNGEVLR